jgi:hypothetical protein
MRVHDTPGSNRSAAAVVDRFGNALTDHQAVAQVNPRAAAPADVQLPLRGDVDPVINPGPSELH